MESKEYVAAMINFDSGTKFFMKSTPTDMRKGYEDEPCEISGVHPPAEQG